MCHLSPATCDCQISKRALLLHVSMCHISITHDTSHITHVTSHITHITCHIYKSDFTCHNSHIVFDMSYFKMVIISGHFLNEVDLDSPLRV